MKFLKITIGAAPRTKNVIDIDLCSLKDRIPPLKKSGIYSLRYNCVDTYIGQTGRTVEKRFKEHNQAYLRGLKMIPHPDYEPRFDSAMAQHCLESGHFFDTVQPSLLHHCDSGPRMNRLEEIYTLLATKDASLRGFNVVNDLTCVFNNSFIRYMLHHDCSL